MEAELVQLAREAVVTLRQPNWAEVAALGIGFGQLVVILGGLWMMNKASNIRNRQLDLMEAAQRDQSERLGTALERQGQAMNQALEHQGQALERQGEMMAEALQGLRQQSEVLAELLRRGA